MKKKTSNFKKLFMEALDDLFIEALEKANKEKVLIKCTGNKGNFNIQCKGGRLTLLLALAGIESNILDQVGASKEEFELIKEYVRTEEVNNG